MKKLLSAICLAATLALTATVLADDAPKRPFISMEGSTVDQIVIGLVPAGLRTYNVYSATVTAGLFEAATGQATNYALLRHDGLFVVDIRGAFFATDGFAVGVRIQGYSQPLPLTPEMFLDPAIEPPEPDEANVRVHGVMRLETMAPQYAFQNHTVFDMHGTFNMATGEMQFTYTAMVD